MAHQGTAFFDNRGQFHKTPEDATMADLAALLGKIGDGESLAPGIAHMLLSKREEIERIFAEHDEMKIAEQESRERTVVASGNVTKLATGRD